MSTPTLAPAPRSAVRAQSRIQLVAPDFRIADSPAAAVLRAAAAQGPISRDAAARTTGLSIATVNRQVAGLLGANLLRERADLTASGAIGRPRVPFEVNHEQYLTVGIHIGAVVTSIVASDLRGRLLGGVEIPTPRSGQDAALAVIARSANAFTARWHRRQPLWVGVAIGGRVDSVSGTADHPRLGWRRARIGAIVGEALGLPISVSAHVEAMAAAELLLAPKTGEERTGGAALYFYARETAGIAITFDGRVHTPTTGPGSIVHLPTGSTARCECGRTGCLEATVSDRALLERARATGVIPDDPRTPITALYTAASAGSLAAHRLLVERAAVLGRTVALLRDMFNPDRVILGGQAFTEYPAAIPHVAEAFDKNSTLARTDIRVSGFSNRVQEYAASVTSLSVLYADPLGAMRRAVGV